MNMKTGSLFCNGGDILVAIDSSCINLQSEATVYLKVKKYPGCYF